MEKSLIFTATGTNQQSLMTAINTFVEAVNAMDDTVMIPSRLQDMDASGATASASGDSDQALIPIGSTGTDLYDFYHMLKTVKRDIISGDGNLRERLGSSSESDDSEDSADVARKTADAFRYHLNGLFDMLHQFTGIAKTLSRRYESEVGSRSSSSASNLTLAL